MAKETARTEFSLFLGAAEDEVYANSCDMINRHDTSSTRAASVRKEVKELGAKFPFSARAQLLFPFLYREFVQNLPLSPELDRSRLYRQALDKVEQCVDAFHTSLVISHFRAEILNNVGQQQDAAQECVRGLNMEEPDDPADQDLPPGSVNGSGYTARVQNLKERILNLLECLENQMAEAAANHQPAVDDHPNDLKRRKSKKKQNKVVSHYGNLPLQKHSMPQVPTAQQAVKEVKQSVIYRFSRLAKKPVPAAPRLEQVLGDHVVPAETVDVYADYCRLLSRCSKYKLICHTCVFEDENTYTCKMVHSDIIWHCGNFHKTPSVECQFDGCYVRFRTDQDAVVHHHFCHYLPKDWWTKW